MTVTSFPIGSEKFVQNYTFHRHLADHLTRDIASQAIIPKSPKISVNDRIRYLLDPGTTFFPLSPLAGWEMYPGIDLPGGGIVTGIGIVMGAMVMIIANDPAVKGGTYFPITVKKHLRAQTIAMENGLPCVYLVDSGGAYLPLQDDVFPDKEHFGRIFYNQARLSAAGCPQIAVVMGSCTAGGAYVPAMADQTIMVREQATIFLGGPPLVQAATGEVVSAEELGGADTHCFTSGVADYYANTEQEALILARALVGDIPGLKKCLSKGIKETMSSETPSRSQPKPKVDPERIYGFINSDLRQPFDVEGILDCIVDADTYHPFKATYGQTLRCGFAHIEGYPVGILVNDGILFSEAAMKGAHFIQLCCQRGIPLVFLQNIMGFMVGKKYEAEGIAKNGAKLVNAVACADVPKLTILIGGSFGAGNYGMCGRAYDPRFLFAWPNSRIGVMGGDQAATVLGILKEEGAQKKGKTISPEAMKIFKQPIVEQYECQGHPYYASARLWDDGIIDPASTRSVLARCLDIVAQAYCKDTEPPRHTKTHFGVFRF